MKRVEDEEESSDEEATLEAVIKHYVNKTHDIDAIFDRVHGGSQLLEYASDGDARGYVITCLENNVPKIRHKHDASLALAAEASKQLPAVIAAKKKNLIALQNAVNEAFAQGLLLTLAENACARGTNFLSQAETLRDGGFVPLAALTLDSIEARLESIDFPRSPLKTIAEALGIHGMDDILDVENKQVLVTIFRVAQAKNLSSNPEWQTIMDNCATNGLFHKPKSFRDVIFRSSMGMVFAKSYLGLIFGFLEVLDDQPNGTKFQVRFNVETMPVHEASPWTREFIDDSAGDANMGM